VRNQADVFIARMGEMGNMTIILLVRKIGYEGWIKVAVDGLRETP
jgi:hypothetical protein